MQIAGHDIGVCSWSLKPKDMADLVRQVKSLGLEHVQLGLQELLFLDDKRKHFELGQLRDSGIHLTSTMISFPGENYSSIATIKDTGGIVPDADWEVRKRLAVEAGKLTTELGLKHLTFHVGFVPPSNHERYAVLSARLCEIAGAVGQHGVELLLETGQEEATVLLQFLNDLACRNVGVNFDPANMILYGAGDPIDAIRTLTRHIQHVHVKDGVASDKPGVTWGQEVPFGKGQVDPVEFLTALREVGYTGPLAFEREAGNDRVADVKSGIEALKTAGETVE